MNQSFRVWFLLIIACVSFHLSGWHTAVVLIGYAIAEYADQWRTKKARAKVLNDVMHGWEQRKDDPEHEDKGNLSRVRLVGQNQIIAARIADLVERMP
jgi:hypothetical protein